MIPIDSPSNEKIKYMARLLLGKGRAEAGLYIAEGERLAADALRAGAQVQFVAVSNDKAEKLSDICAALEKSGAQVYLCAPNVIKKLCDTKTPQGIVLAVKQRPSKAGFGKKVLVLDGVADPGNVGTMLRTAQAFGCCDAVLSSGSVDPFSPKCVRSGMGAHFFMDIRVEKDVPGLLFRLEASGYGIVGGSLSGEETPQLSQENRACVVGSEARGISEKAALACTALWRIPMSGTAESLNAAVAAGIMMYTVFK